MNSSSTSALVHSRPRVAVIGAGVGGLSAALELVARGADVTLFERSAQVGGKMRREGVGALAVDAGPTVLTMLHVFEELFARSDF